MLYARLAHVTLFIPSEYQWVKNKDSNIWEEVKESKASGSHGFVYAIGGKSNTTTSVLECEIYDIY